ncbi:MAG: NAD-dependent epimerase/dehydratase family protein [Hyphomicrobiaceae bacterium]|nr:MAG: NAD-dependent epimerase/dehydratase family protein [Hyphomicrobiaceae bacterium]
MLALMHQNTRPTKPKRAVVVGAGGMVGGSIVQELAKSGIPTLALTRKEVDLLGSSGSDQLKSALSVDDAIVFVSAVAPAKNAAQLMANLRMAEAALAAFAAASPAHLLYISSDAIYADDANPVTERSPVAPSTTHGMMHAARELMFRSEYRGPFAALRPTLIYGARDPHSGYGPNRFRRQAAKGEPITIFGEGEEKRDHVAVEDVARLAVRILLHRSTGALNAATGVATSFHDIAHIVAHQFEPPAQVISVPRPGPRPHLLHRFFDITECFRAFPDFHFEPLEQGLARVHGEVFG